MNHVWDMAAQEFVEFAPWMLWCPTIWISPTHRQALKESA